MFESHFRKLVFRQLRSIEGGSISIRDQQGSNTFGDPGSELNANVEVKNPKFYRRLVLGGGIGAAESLANGEWECGDLTALVRIFIRNLQSDDAVNNIRSSLGRGFARFAHYLNRNTSRNAKRNIIKHYDLIKTRFDFLNRLPVKIDWL